MYGCAYKGVDIISAAAVKFKKNRSGNRYRDLFLNRYNSASVLERSLLFNFYPIAHISGWRQRHAPAHLVTPNAPDVGIGFPSARFGAIYPGRPQQPVALGFRQG
jgi:hypothetical protein